MKIVVFAALLIVGADCAKTPTLRPDRQYQCDSAEQCKSVCVQGKSSQSGSKMFCTVDLVKPPPDVYVLRTCGVIPPTKKEFFALGEEGHAIMKATKDACAAVHGFYGMCESKDYAEVGCLLNTPDDPLVKTFDEACGKTKFQPVVRSGIRATDDTQCILGTGTSKRGPPKYCNSPDGRGYMIPGDKECIPLFAHQS